MGEKDIENKIKKYLKSQGAYFIKTHGSAFQKVGVPDILACYKGRFMGIEVKDIGKKPNESQIIHINNIIKAGGIAFATDNLEDVIREVDKI